jgi:hypothetical protein
MQNVQRPLNSSTPEGIARSGAAKKLTTPTVVVGQVRQTKGEPAAYHHGVSVDDTPNTVKSHTKPVAIHPSATENQRTELFNSASAKGHLLDAARLGRGEKA